MKILVSALETSSNLHLAELKKYLDNVKFEGIFELEDQKGFYTPKDFSVMGFVDIFKKLIFFKKVLNEMVKKAEEVDKVLLLDSSGFNLPLAKAIKKYYPQKQIIYYILPQVWAWKPWRVEALKKYCDKLYGILPFEIAMYQGRAEYIGHPLLDEISQFKLKPSNTGNIVFMPGSRKQEIKRMLPIFFEIAKEFKKERCVLVIPPHFDQRRIQEYYGDLLQGFEISYDANFALYEAKFAFICSGTATLQSALIGTPFVLAYQAKKLDYCIASAFVKLRHIGLANILYAHFGQGEIHQELIQAQCTKENLIRAYHAMESQEFFGKIKELRKYLAFGSSKRLAQKIME
ncbi:lipid-A-disaccharide synthase [Helicobacter cholecystus]|uniref:lipid-A-disaccharide synthase n=1 Tax=Helicobacter cholecystus TaxID=45498 RepID=UPI00273A3814|nr:lipid-A-disaccharide synthase [Helicobacter cholecystus]